MYKFSGLQDVYPIGKDSLKICEALLSPSHTAEPLGIVFFSLLHRLSSWDGHSSCLLYSVNVWSTLDSAISYCIEVNRLFAVDENHFNKLFVLPSTREWLIGTFPFYGQI